MTTKLDPKHDLKLKKDCPKCGNSEGLMYLPGHGLSYYYCPKCHENKARAVVPSSQETPSK